MIMHRTAVPMPMTIMRGWSGVELGSDRSKSFAWASCGHEKPDILDMFAVLAILVAVDVCEMSAMVGTLLLLRVLR